MKRLRSWAVLRTATATALVVGAISNVVNHGSQLLRPSELAPLPVVLNFALPFCVSMWSGVIADRRRGR